VRQSSWNQRTRSPAKQTGLADLAHLAAGDLSMGQRKMVGVARSLAADAHVLVLRRRSPV
jgi:ABC-type branched-subunit amino acid transport system ATPase component